LDALDEETAISYLKLVNELNDNDLNHAVKKFGHRSKSFWIKVLELVHGIEKPLSEFLSDQGRNILSSALLTYHDNYILKINFAKVL